MQINLLKSLHAQLSRRRKVHLYSVFCLLLMVSILEVISIGSVIPFLSLILDPDSYSIYLNNNIYLKNLDFILKSENFMMIATSAFISIIMVAALGRVLLLWGQTKLSHAIGHDISYELYNCYLYTPFISHLSQNSSTAVSAITTKTNIVSNSIVNPILIVFSSLVMAIILISTLAVLNPILTCSALVFFSFVYVMIFGFARKYIGRARTILSEETDNIFKEVSEGLGGIREIILTNNQNFHLQNFKKHDASFRNAQATISILAVAPKNLVEALGIVFVVVFTSILAAHSDDPITYLPLLAAFALATQRLLPLLQAIYNNITAISGSLDLLKDVLKILDARPSFPPAEIRKSLPFKSKFELKKISFTYLESDKYIFDKFDFQIKKGDKVGIIGASGSGKSTLLDLVSGLIEPQEGHLLVDGEVVDESKIWNWRQNVAYVSQDVYLMDDSIKRNIVGPIPDQYVDFSLLNRILVDLDLKSLVDSFEDGINTSVGERGVSLSGGQKQRLGIARAIYQKRCFWILDEVTSSLDSVSENFVMNALEWHSKSDTFIFVTHRAETLKICDHIYELAGSRLIEKEISEIREIN